MGIYVRYQKYKSKHYIFRLMKQRYHFYSCMIKHQEEHFKLFEREKLIFFTIYVYKNFFGEKIIFKEIYFKNILKSLYRNNVILIKCIFLTYVLYF